MKISFINPIINSCINVLSTMAQIEPQAGKPITRKLMKSVEGHNITGLICMYGPKHRASFAVIFPEKTLVNVAQKIIATQSDKLDYIAIELAGELSNMIMGGAKNILVDEGYEFAMQLPTVIVGNDYLIAHQTKSPIIQLPFATVEGPFYIEASLEGGAVSKPKTSNTDQTKLGDYDENNTLFF